MRRVLTVSHSYVVSLNRRLAHELARAGWEVTAVAPRAFRGDLRTHLLEPAGDACRVVGVPAHATWSPHAFFYGRALRGVLRQPWDVVHCWEEPFTFAGGQVAWWTSPPARLVYATFQNLAKRYPPPFSWIEEMALARAAGWVAFGHTVAATLGARELYRARPTATIPPGVDVERFKPDPDARARARRELGLDGIVVGYLGRFVPEKGVLDLIAALERSTARALFVGGGALEPDVRAFAARHPDRVRVVTDAKHDDVPPLLRAMDLLVAPSRTTPRWREQFGRMLIEAFAAGVPVLATDSGEIPHVVSDAGAIVPEGDSAALGRAIEELLADPARRTELSARGLERARREFAWPVVAGRWGEFFERLLGGGA